MLKTAICDFFGIEEIVAEAETIITSLKNLYRED